jgi:hypothetical protein
MKTCEACQRFLPTGNSMFCSAKCYQRSLLPEGTRRIHIDGYVNIKVGGRFVPEHRHVMSQHLGRPLERRESILHKDGNRQNNAIGNLELWRLPRTQPPGIRATDYHCAGCRCGDGATATASPTRGADASGTAPK